MKKPGYLFFIKAKEKKDIIHTTSYPTNIDISTLVK
uniref:Uncharacterized protein n=1 Tax=Mimivirus LCMiAC01 TaxID=2506608 RepID=A0A481YZI5_9VIRU|nr:MAG: hypothetical protein LCMiAC01_00840 [Mimivirus LCMiAC01]